MNPILYGLVGTHFDVLPEDIKLAIDNNELSAEEIGQISNLANPDSPAMKELELYASKK